MASDDSEGGEIEIMMLIILAAIFVVALIAMFIYQAQQQGLGEASNISATFSIIPRP